MKILVTGGCGFIGSALIRHLMAHSAHEIINLDALTYAATSDALAEIARNERYQFVHGDIRDADTVEQLFVEHVPDAVMHLAAESHVDRSIDDARPFVETNVLGTQVMLDAALRHYRRLPASGRKSFRFHHISTDEVFGSLGPTGYFTEETPYAPRSPYAASKAASDHLVRAWHHTHGMPTIISNCSNNYGPFQFPEKLIPLMILNAVDQEPLPVYGAGDNVRDWLHVEDHARALHCVLEEGEPGSDYNVGGDGERTNLEVVEAICRIMDERRPDHAPHRELIRFVTDRPGHDRRYAIDATKIRQELGWAPLHSFESGLRQTVEWYLAHLDWCRSIQQRQQDALQRRGLSGCAA
ncbi:dTDP-glucose 4,6-dehydratase [Algiphilus sp.]|uniref:dTDP-glucose 4,6-dehydratase n=1 Tax=Algiphilus sp. TaxID=1872431 RepID=UPI003B52D67F